MSDIVIYIVCILILIITMNTVIIYNTGDVHDAITHKSDAASLPQ